MPSCLIVENDGPTIEQIRNALTSEGWPVHIAEDARTALTENYEPSPDLVFVNTELRDSANVLTRFSRKGSLSCSISLCPEGWEASDDDADGPGDEELQKPFEEAEFWAVVRGLLSARFKDEQAADSASMQKLTSEEIFGDVLAELDFEPEEPEEPEETEAESLQTKAEELEAESLQTEADLSEKTAPPSKKPPATFREKDQSRQEPNQKPEDEVQRKLAETLSGVLEPSFLSPKVQEERPKAPLSKDLSNIDKLLSDSLSGLNLGKKLKADSPDSEERAPRDLPSESSSPSEGDGEDKLLEDLDLSFLDATPTSQVQPPSDPPDGPGETSKAKGDAEPNLASRAASASPPSKKEDSFKSTRAITPTRGGEADGMRFGHYTLLEKIAVGGMAEVWKARMDGVAGFQKTVAIKKILSHLTENIEFERMFVDEAKLAAELNHPNITHIYDLGVIQSDFYIAMEYVEGGNLRFILDTANRKGMPIPQDLSLLITSRMASALDYAHRKRDADDKELGLVHRDVSPQNVLISYEGDIKLCDFGIVKAVSKTSQTKAGALKGKLQYMAPEQAWGREVDGRSDIFSLGTLLFEMLTGVRLFPGNDELAILEAVREGRVKEPRELDPTIPESINELVTKCLARDPKQRFQSADRLRDEVESCLENLTLRPSNADLAAYLRRLMSAAEPDEDFPDEPTDLADRVARFPLPVVEDPEEEEVADESPDSTTTAGDVETASESDLGHLVEAIAPLDEVEIPTTKSSSRWIWIVVALGLLAAAIFFWSKNRPSSQPQSLPTAGAAAQPQSGTQAPPTTPEETPATGESPDEAAPPEGTPENETETPASSAPTTGNTSRDLQQERERIQEAAAVQLAQEEAALRKSYESQEKQLETKLSKLTQDGASAQPRSDPKTTPKRSDIAGTSPRPTEAKTAAETAKPGPGVKPPVLVSMKKPQYPAEARGKNIQGEIVLSLLVNESGNVDQVRQIEGVNPELGLNEAAIQAARAATFKPATQQGTRVKMWTTLKIPYPM